MSVILSWLNFLIAYRGFYTVLYMNHNPFSLRWWVTTIVAGMLGRQIAVGLLQGWPYWVVAILVLALCALLFFVRRWAKRDRAAQKAVEDSEK
jgi:hypothetical protein